MQFAKERVLGYLFLVVGLILIIYPTFSVYQVFTKKSQPVDLFAFEAISLDFSKYAEGPVPPGTDLTQELVKSEMINEPMNLFAHLFLMGFIASVGLKVASIGTMLVRPIKVNLKEASSTSERKNPNIPPWKS